MYDECEGASVDMWCGDHVGGCSGSDCHSKQEDVGYTVHVVNVVYVGKEVAGCMDDKD